MKKLLLVISLLLSANAYSDFEPTILQAPIITTIAMGGATTNIAEYSAAAVSYTSIFTLCVVGQCFHKENIAPELQNEMLTIVMTDNSEDMSDDLSLILTEFREELEIENTMSDIEMLQSIIQDSFEASLNK